MSSIIKYKNQVLATLWKHGR